MKRIIFCLVVLFVFLFPVFADGMSISTGIICGESFADNASGFSYYEIDRSPGFSILISGNKTFWDDESLKNEFRLKFESFPVTETYYCRDHLWELWERDLEEERYKRKGKYNYLSFQWAFFCNFFSPHIRICPFAPVISYREDIQFGWQELLQIDIYEDVFLEVGGGILYSGYEVRWEDYDLKSTTDKTQDFNLFASLGWQWKL